MLVDDDPNLLNALKRHFRKRFNLLTAIGSGEALDCFNDNNAVAVAVVDMCMPGMDGLQLLGRIKEVSPDTMRIMLTGNADQQTAVDAVNKGNVFRFLAKPCTPNTLAEAIEEAIGEHRRIIAMRKNIAELRKSAFTDELTGVGNRRHFYELARHETRRARRSGKPLSALMIDADYFKKVNDNFGHQVGDKVLQMVARICAESLREADVLGRFGGEEFAILFPETNIITAKNIAERIRKAVASEVVEAEDGPVRITISIGVSTGMGKEVKVDALLERADANLYVAKQNGRDRVEIDQDSSLDSRSETQ